MYPFLKLEDSTEIVHSDVLNDERVKVYIEKPVEGGFCSAVCYLPPYEWNEIEGFSQSEIEVFQEIITSFQFG